MLTLREKLIAALRGGGHPAGVALAVALGLVAGFTSGVNLTFALLVWAALVLNVRTLVFVATWALGLVLAIALHSICHGAGYALLDELRLGPLLASLGESPIIALLDWDRYALVGGMAIALVLAVPAARGAWTIADARWRAAHEGNPPRGRWFRPLALLHAPIAAVPLVLLPWTLVEWQLADELLGEALEFTDCQAVAGRTELCLWTGAWVAEHVAIVERDHPEVPVMVVQRIEAQLQPSRLLRGWLHIDRLKLEGVERVERPRTGQDTEEYETPEGVTELNHCLVGWSQRRDLMAWGGQALELLDRLARLDQLRSHSASHPLISPLASTPDEPRSRLGRREPRVVVHWLSIDDLAATWRLGKKARIEIDELTSNPRLALRPTHVKVVAPEWSAQAEVQMSLHDPGQRHQVQLRATDLPVAELLDPARIRSRLVVHRGLVSASGAGWIDRHRVYLPLTLESQQLSAQWLGSTPVAGVSPEAWNRGLRELGGVRAEALLAGRWDDLRLTLETREVINQFKHQLRSAGAHDLFSAIDEELTEARAKVASHPGGHSGSVELRTTEALPTATAQRPTTEAAAGVGPTSIDIPTPTAERARIESVSLPTVVQTPTAPEPSNLVAPEVPTAPSQPPVVAPPAVTPPAVAPPASSPVPEADSTSAAPLPGTPYYPETAPLPQIAPQPAAGVAVSYMENGGPSQVPVAATSSITPPKATISTPQASIANPLASPPSHPTMSRSANPGPIDLATGPDLEGLYARRAPAPIRTNPITKSPPSTSPAPQETGLGKWSRDMSNRLTSKVGRSTTAPTPSTHSGTSYATDDPSGGRVPEAPAKSWWDRFRW